MSNRRNGLTITFGLADLPMLAGAFSIARNAAMMSGRPRHKARLEAFRLQVEAAIPPAAKLFGTYDFCDIVLAIEAGATYSVRAERKDWYGDHTILVTVGDKSYKARETVKDGHEALVASTLDLLDQISAITAEA